MCDLARLRAVPDDFADKTHTEKLTHPAHQNTGVQMVGNRGLTRISCTGPSEWMARRPVRPGPFLVDEHQF